MKNEQTETPQPAAYDADGRPLYYQEPAEQSAQPESLITSKPTMHDGHNFNPQLRAQHSNEPKLVHATRDAQPIVSKPSERIQRKHEECVKKYPFLNLSEGEYVILQISRHPIGILLPLIFTGLAVIIFSTFMFLVPDFFDSMGPSSMYASFAPMEAILIAVLGLLAILSAVFGGIAIWVYQRNQFFMTNESVIQEIQHSIFSRHEQTVSLGSIEDASFKRQGILQHIFNYGTIRLSTEGEETTYRFSYVEDPKRQVAIVNNAVEAFKNGRPVDDDDN